MFNPNMKLSFVLLVVLVASACAKQCCPPGHVITRRGKCNDTMGNVTPTTNFNCTNGRWILKDVIIKGTKVYSSDATNYVFVEDPTQYCLGESYRNFSEPSTGLTASAVICFESTISKEDIESESKNMMMLGSLALVSVVFLALTLLVYMFLPQMRDLQGMCYICLCVSMGLGFFCLGLMQLKPRSKNAQGISNEDCTAAGFMIYFWMMATFFWMNVISINTYRSIVDSNYVNKTENRQFFYYSCYSWGGPLIFLVIALTTNFMEGDHLKPNINEFTCWVTGYAETWLYFYGPIALLVTCNIALCVLSSLYLWKQNRKYEVNKLNNLRHKFLLSLKLFLVMGVSWIFEIASFAHGVSWVITDTFNCLQGVVIFLLLVVLRRRAIRGLAEHNVLPCITQPLAEMLSPHDEEDEEILSCDDTVEVRLN